MPDKKPNEKGFISGLLTLIVSYANAYWLVIVYISKQIIFKRRKLEPIPNRAGDIVVITGGNKGLGAEVVKDLLKAEIDTAAGHKLIETLRSSGLTSGSAEIFPIDLKSFVSVKAFARRVLDLNEPISLLINNAGCFTKYSKTMDGFNEQLQVNYLSPFLLTLQLLPALAFAGKEGKASRVVNLSSMTFLYGKVDLEDFTMTKYWNQVQAYGNTKLYVVIFSNYLNKLCEKEKLHIKSYSVHPGIVATHLFDHIIFAKLTALLFKVFALPVRKGGDTIVWTALSEEAEALGGKMIDNCQIMKMNLLAEEEKLQAKVWEKTVKLLNLDWASRSLIQDPFLLLSP